MSTADGGVRVPSKNVPLPRLGQTGIDCDSRRG